MPTDASTHPSLLRRVRDAHDHAAWRAFDRRYGPLILAFGRRIGLQVADAEDVRQAVMMNLARTLPGFRYDPARGRFRTYLGRAVVHAVAELRRRHGRLRTLDVDHAAPETLDASWQDEWVRHHCRAALHTLRDEADPVHLAMFDAMLNGRSTATIAAMFEVSPAAVRKTRQRLRDRLRAIVARQIRAEETGDA